VLITRSVVWRYRLTYCGDGADILIGGLGKDSFNLTETTAATDTVRIASGDSLITSYDVTQGFRLEQVLSTQVLTSLT